MKTRTLLLLSVATGLVILLAGGILLLQLSNEQDTIDPSPLGQPVIVGEMVIVVESVSEADGLVSVAVEIGGVDDGVDSLRLVTGDRRLEPVTAPARGRCTEITVEPARCTLDYDVSGASGANRTLVVRRGDDQANWILAEL